MTDQTSSTSSASPRPWRVGSADTSDYMGDLPRGSYYIDDASMEVIAEISSCGVPLPRHRANAALIVEAVNEHDRLTADNARLREALVMADQVIDGLLNGDGAIDTGAHDALEIIRAALEG